MHLCSSKLGLPGCYIHQRQQRLQDLRNACQEYQLLPEQKFFIDTVAEIPEKLPLLLTTGTVDAIICTGGVDRYENVLQTLGTQENWKNIPVFMEKNHLTNKLQKKYQHRKIELTPAHYDRKALGRCAGLRMAEFLKGEITSFTSVLVATKDKIKEK